ncbi:MAG: hypothetical protein QM674_19870 [Burkholderiaceae bacterium]
MTTIDTLTEALIERAPEVPDEIPVISLDSGIDPLGRGTEIAHRLGTMLGWDPGRAKADRGITTTVLRDESGARTRLFHASGALAMRSATGSFEELFDGDPGEEKLTALTEGWVDRLGLRDLLPDGDRLDHERLWRIRAAGSDTNGKLTEPVLCRAIGALRHRVYDLPVLGRASAHVEVTGQGNLSGLSVSLRRFAGGRDKVLTTLKPRPVDDAAREIAERLARALGGPDTLEGAEITAEALHFGYLSLGRRRAQSLLAPMYVAQVAVAGTVRSAHVLPVAGSVERFLKVPSGSRAAATMRAA